MKNSNHLKIRIIGLFIFLNICALSVHATADIKANSGGDHLAALRLNHPLKLDMPINVASLQDRDGFIWIAAQNGLVKYDGYESIVFRTGPNSISNDNVTSVIEDSSGKIWVGTQGGGIDRYDKETRRFTVYRHDPKNPKSLGSDAVALGQQALFMDASGVLWIGTQGSGLDRFNPKTGVFDHYRHEPKNSQSLMDDTVWSIAEDPWGRLWIGTSSGLEELDRKSGVFTHYPNNPLEPDGIGKGWVYRILIDQKDPSILWLGTIGGGLKRFDTNRKIFTHYNHDPKTSGNESNDEIAALCQDNQNRLWIGWYRVPAAGGVSVFDKITGTFSDVLPNPNDLSSLSSTQVHSILKDDSGNMWLFNFNGAIDIYDPVGQVFQLYRHTQSNPTSLSDNTVVPIYQDRDGVIWIGTLSGGLNRYYPDDNSFSHYLYDPRDPSSIPNNFVTRIFEDNEGTFWVATRGGALSVFDRRSGRCIKHYRYKPGNPNSIPENDSIRFIIQDKDDPDILWMGAYLGGFFKFNKRTEKFTNYPVNTADPKALNSNCVMYLYQDSAGMIWLATIGGGLNLFDKRSGTFSHFVNEKGNKESLGANQLWEIQEYEPGFLWIATVGGGLEKFDKQRRTFKRYAKENGFPVNTVLTIRRDKGGAFWMGTDEGLVKFNPESGKTRVYKKNDGLQGDVFLDAAALYAENGEMWLGGINGLNRFNPEQVRDNPYIPPVVLTSFKQGGEEIHFDKDLSRLRQIKLDWRQNFFEFEYAALCYTRPEKNQYAYKLEGFDKDWYYAGTLRFGRYSGLPPGNYTLRIRGSNNDGLWNNQGVSLRITITPPYWASWWFKGLIAFVLAVCGLGAFLLRVRMLENQKRQLEFRVTERTRELKRAKEVAEEARQEAEVANRAKSVFLANMSHELRTPLNSIMGYAQILKRGQSDQNVAKGLDIIYQSSNHLLTLINDILDLSKVEADKMELFPSEIALPEFLELIAGVVRNRAQAKNLDFSMETSGRMPSFIVGDEVRLRQVLLNLLGNAVKFTDNGKVTFKVTAMEENGANHPEPQVRLRFEIIDTGIGLTAGQIEQLFQPFTQVGPATRQAEGTGLGLAISRRLVRLMGSDIFIESQPGQGSRFWFDIPLLVVESMPVQEPQPIITGYLGLKRKILVVDDLPANRNVLIDLLKPMGFEVIEAENGEQAVESVLMDNPDLVLMDRFMPVMDGLEAVRRIRRMDGKQPLIVAVSASVAEKDMQESLAMGFDDFLMKPVDRIKLEAVLEKHLHLVWEVQSEKLSDGKAEPKLIPPPPEELAVLVELAQLGDIRAIQERIPYLESLNMEYRPFIMKLAQLAEGFKEKEILALLKQYVV